MKRGHALLIALAIGLAAVAGLVAATRTAQLRSSSQQPGTSAAQIAGRMHALNRTEVALKKALKQKPPKLPALPATTTPAATPTGAVSMVAAAAPPRVAAAAPSRPAQPQRIVYVRPAPIIRHVPRAGSEREYEHETEGGSEHEGEGGFDD